MVASEPFPRAGVAVVGGECADGQGDGVAERSGMWGGTPNRPAMGPEHPVAGPGRWGTERPAANRWGPDRLVEPDRADAVDGRHALDRDAALTPIFTALRRGRWRRPRGQAGLRDCGWRPSRWSAARTARRRPRSRSSRPCTRSTRTRRAATTQRPSTRPGRAVSGGSTRTRRGVSGESAACVGRLPRGRALCVERIPLAGRRAVRIRWSPGGVRRPAHVGRRASARAAREPRASCIGRTAAAASVDPFDPGSFAPRAAPPSRTETTAVWSPGDYSMPPQQVTDTGRHHRRLAPAGW